MDDSIFNKKEATRQPHRESNHDMTTVPKLSQSSRQKLQDDEQEVARFCSPMSSPRNRSAQKDSSDGKRGCFRRIPFSQSKAEPYVASMTFATKKVTQVELD